MLAYGDALAIALLRKRRGLAAIEFYRKHDSKWSTKTVKDVMTSDRSKMPVAVLSNCKIADAIPKLLGSHTGVVAVLNDKGHLVDALTDSDIQLLSKISRPDIATVDEALTEANCEHDRKSVLSLGLCVVLEDEFVVDAVLKMTNSGQRGCFVANGNGDCVGFLSLAECFQAGVLPVVFKDVN